MAKKSDIKRKHHYVWAHYLKRWSSNNRDVWYTTKTNKVAHDSVYGLAYERDFYKVNFLDEDDLKFIRGFSSLSPDDLRLGHEVLLDYFYSRSSAARNGQDITQVEKTKRLIEFQHNALENLHASHEQDAIGIIDSLVSGDMAVMKDPNNHRNFMMFFGLQITRSKASRERAFDAALTQQAYDGSPNPPYSFENYKRLMRKNWWLLSYMFGMNVGASLEYTSPVDTHVLLINDTGEPFITSDRPIINVHSSIPQLPKNTPPTAVDFFYPISPRHAYMINHSGRYSAGSVNVSTEDVFDFNMQIALGANEHIFSSTRKQLVDVKESVRARKRASRRSTNSM